MPDKHYMTKEAASHIQSTQAKAGHDMSSGSFAAKAQSAGATNANRGIGGTSYSSGQAAGNKGGNSGGNGNSAAGRK